MVEEVRVSVAPMVGGRRRVHVGDRIEESVNLSREEVDLSARPTSGVTDATIEARDDS